MAIFEHLSLTYALLYSHALSGQVIFYMWAGFPKIYAFLLLILAFPSNLSFSLFISFIFTPYQLSSSIGSFSSLVIWFSFDFGGFDFWLCTDLKILFYFGVFHNISVQVTTAVLADSRGRITATWACISTNHDDLKKVGFRFSIIREWWELPLIYDFFSSKWLFSVRFRFNIFYLFILFSFKLIFTKIIPEMVNFIKIFVEKYHRYAPVTLPCPWP